MASLSTVAAFGFGDFDPPQMLELYRRLGCTSCQFYRNEANPPAVADVRRITADAGLAVDSIHGVFGEAYDPSSLDESHRRQTVEVYRREAELAAELGGPMVVVHPAAPVPGDALPDDDQRQAHFEAFRKSVDEMTPIAADIGVTFLYENIPDNYWVGNDPLALARLLRDLDSPHARMCFDTGHALMTGTIADRMAACSDVIGYLHVHDNDAIVDDHRMPGDGVTDWPEVGRTLRQQGIDVIAMLEVFYLAPQLEKLLRTDLPANLADWLNIQSPAHP